MIIISLFLHLQEKWISAVVFLSLKFNCPSFLTILIISLLYVEGIRAGIDFTHGKPIFARNKTTKTATKLKTSSNGLNKQYLPTTYKNRLFVISFVILLILAKLSKTIHVYQKYNQIKLWWYFPHVKPMNDIN